MPQAGSSLPPQIPPESNVHAVCERWTLNFSHFFNVPSPAEPSTFFCLSFFRACHGLSLVCRPGVGPGRAGGPSTFYIMVGGPARPVKFSEDGPRPGLAHQISGGRAAARPGRSKFQRMGRRPTQPIIFSIFHGPAHQFFRSLGPTRPGPSQFSDRPGSARPRQTAYDKPRFLSFATYLGFVFFGVFGSWGILHFQQKKTNVNGAAGAHKGAAPARDISRTKTC